MPGQSLRLNVLDALPFKAARWINPALHPAARPSSMREDINSGCSAARSSRVIAVLFVVLEGNAAALCLSRDEELCQRVDFRQIPRTRPASESGGACLSGDRLKMNVISSLPTARRTTPIGARRGMSRFAVTDSGESLSHWVIATMRSSACG